MWSRVAVVIVSLTAGCHAGLLGAGTGEGSCAAAPFRAPAGALKWALGCPAGAECCTEFGYCRSQSEWALGQFRDCNGVSNGKLLGADVIEAENLAAAYGDVSAAGLIAVPAGASGYAAAPIAVAAAPAVAYAGAGYGYASAPAAVGTGYGYAAALSASIGTSYGYAAAAPATIGNGYGYAAAAPAGYANTYAGAGYGVVPAANTGYIVSGY